MTFINVFYQRLKNKILLILVSQGVKTFFLSIFILFIVHYLIIKHLTTIKLYLNDFSLDSTDIILSLGRSKKKEADELDETVNALNEMQERIRFDLQTQTRTDRALKESEQKFRSIFENAPLAMVHLDKHGVTTEFNENLCEILGTSKEKLTGFNALENLKDDKMLSSLKKAFYGKKSYYEGDYLSITGNVLTSIIANFSPVFSTDKKVNGVIGILEDITEKRKMEEQLIQAQKMESIGILAGGIAHDFNNILGIITGNVSFALSNLDKNDELFEVLSDIQDGSMQAQKLTYQLLTFAKGGVPIKKIIDINKLIKESVTFSTRGTKANCIYKLSKDLWTAEVDEGQINQVIGNLIINANQAMPDGGTITIKTENIIIKSQTSLPLPPGRYVTIIVEDKGIGIDKKHLSLIFDPYFTTKQKGNGLGLATTYSIIKKHDGHIEVYSELNKGTSFYIYLPASFKVIEETKKTTEHSHQGYGKILIMDDQEAILKMLGRMLNKMGYEAAFATDGAQAIKMYSKAYESKQAFDLVILDLTVPGGMGGNKTIIELLKIDPNVKAVVSSGYSNDPIMADYQKYGFCGVIPKPFTKKQLSQLLNTIKLNTI